jgi:hypothetical protein
MKQVFYATLKVVKPLFALFIFSINAHKYPKMLKQHVHCQIILDQSA